MKKVLVLVLLVCLAHASQAQFLGGFFNQKATEKKYALQQIAELQVYLQLLKKGYKISKQGLTLVGNIKRGDWTMHGDYFDALKKVNPHVAGYAKVAAIMLLARQVIAISKADKSQVNGSKFYTSGERGYVDRMYEQLARDLEDDLDFLTTLVTDGKLTMKDDERIGHIDRLYAAMQSRFVFASAFSQAHQGSLNAREQQSSDLETLKKLYNVELP